ncbi:MAG: nitrilase [Phycisphaeraceae bacterium]|nr:MAG: nitrilase [Phycisphaeraceae bacterium]
MRAALAQIAPVFLDRDATLAKAADAVKTAAAQGASLVCFAETLVPAYPLWLARTNGAAFDDDDQKTLHALYLDQAVTVERNHLAPLTAAAREHNTWIVVGVAERPADRAGHTLFASAVTINPHGDIASVHRKLVPTYEERLAWSHGDANGLVAHAMGSFTLGSLNCWENWMPLPRAALQAQGVSVHVAIWPGNVNNTEHITRFVARESRAYVLSASAIIRASDIPKSVPLRDKFVTSEDEILHNGGSAAANPDGSWLLEPQANTEDVFVVDLDPAFVRRERQNFDPAGHYARPELLRLSVDRRRITSADFTDA